jgi:hypothetical protein
MIIEARADEYWLVIATVAALQILAGKDGEEASHALAAGLGMSPSERLLAIGCMARIKAGGARFGFEETTKDGELAWQVSMVDDLEQCTPLPARVLAFWRNTANLLAAGSFRILTTT